MFGNEWDKMMGEVGEEEVRKRGGSKGQMDELGQWNGGGEMW